MGKKPFVIKPWMVIAWFIITIILVISTPASVDPQAKITQLSVCSGLDAKGIPIPITKPITANMKEIHICSYLEGNAPTIPLVFYLKYGKKSITKPITGNHKPGYITVYFSAPSEGFKAGNYLVLVVNRRRELASVEFTILER